MITSLLLAMQAKSSTSTPASDPSWISLELLQLLLIAVLVWAFLRARRRSHDLRRVLNKIELSNRHTIVQSEQLAVESHRARSFFLDHLSHQLRTPLNIIFGYAELLEDELRQKNLTASLSDLSHIREAGLSLQHLIDQVIAYSKIENGKEQLSIDDFSIKQLFDEFASLYKPILEKNGNQLEFQQDGQVKRLATDLNKLKHILGHVLQNANQFTHNGLIRLEVSKLTLRNGPGVRFLIRDNGSGIAPSVEPHLFEIFTTADPNCNLPGSGAGLGLAISRAYARLLGGEISLVSTSEQGSCFQLDLPARLVSSLADLKDQEDDSPVKHIKVLCIDSDPAGARQLAQLLAGFGCQATLCHDAKSGLLQLENQMPDLILLETCMQNQGGLEFLRGLQACAGPTPPLLLLSPFDAVGAAYMLGVLGYLFKPIEERRLIGLLSQLYPKPPAEPILVVDDDRAASAFVTKWLERSGWTVLEARNGIDALQLLEQQRPALILLDLIMPGLGGFEFFQQISLSNDYRDIPVIFVTGARPTDNAKLRLGRNCSVLRYHGDFNAPDFAVQLETQMRLLLSESIP